MGTTPVPRSAFPTSGSDQACDSERGACSQRTSEKRQSRGVHLDSLFGNARMSPWMINSYVKDFGNPPSPVASDYLPSPDLEISTPRNGLEEERLEQVIPMSLSDDSEASTNPFIGDTNRPCPSAEKEAWEESILRMMMNEEYAAALERSSSSAQSGSDCNEYSLTPSKQQKDSRRAHTSSQSYSSRLFELELSPIFEDAPVLSSTGGFVLPQDDSANSRELVPCNPDPASSNEDCGAIYDSSESSYGELIDVKAFGSVGCEMHRRMYECGQSSERFGTSTEESGAERLHEQSFGSQLLDPDSFEEEYIETSARPIIPSLVLIQPTPETTKSSGFFKDHQSLEDSSAGHDSLESTLGPRERDEYHSRRESDESVRRPSGSTPTWPNDTVGSSVNTAEAGGHTGLGADEHGTLLPSLPVDGSSPTGMAAQLTEALARAVTRCNAEAPSTSTKTKRRWSLVSKSNTYTTKSTVTDRSRRSSNSIWTRFSTAVSSGKKTSVGSLGECGSGSPADREDRTLGCQTSNGTPALENRICDPVSPDSGDAPGFVEEQGRRRRSELGFPRPPLDIEISGDRNDLALKRVLTTIPLEFNDRSGSGSRSKFSSLLQSFGSRISTLRMRTGRRSDNSKWEIGRSIPPKMV